MNNGILGKWIAAPGADRNFGAERCDSAPHFRREFEYEEKFEHGRVSISGLGFYELYLNGRKVGDRVLDPAVSDYLKHVRFVTLDITDYLRPGRNTVGVILGNGWYNPNTAEVWNFLTAPWRDCPKFALKLEIDGRTVLESDETWRVGKGPIVFNALRNGEFYDARLEVPGWTGDRFDDSAWPHAVRIAPPGGEPVEQKQPPCRVLGTFPAVPTGKFDVYDTKQNMAGWARITVEGEAGAEVTLRYAERLTPEGDLSAESQDVFVKSGEFQTDRYILKGGGVEIWEPRFTYHGFQFIKATVSGNAAIRKIEARMVGTAFDSVGRITMSEPDLNRLQAMTRWAYRSNYVGIPTDCPHREKNGWTGDAMLAAETGLFNFDPAASYLEWLQILADNQRPNGQLSGIAPSGGWGFNWGSGPAWDSVLLSMPADIYLHTGDDTAIRCFYDAMKRYLDYCESMATDHIVFFGLGDWCHPDREKMCPVEITSTGYYYMDAQLLSEFARILGRPEDEKRYGMLAEAIKKAFNARFLRKNGRYGTGSGIGEFTATGCALYHDLVPGEYKQPAVEFLAEHARRINCACDFGILGAKYIPRVLAEYGHAELALKFFTRHEFPGWAHWIDLGMTTLGENWTGNNSRNHIMFGDLSAWFYRYLGGFRHEWERPGYRHLRVRPFPVIASCIAEYRGYVSDWKVEDGEFVIQLSVPSGCTATLAMPDGSAFELESGRYQRSCRLS